MNYPQPDYALDTLRGNHENRISRAPKPGGSPDAKAHEAYPLQWVDKFGKPHRPEEMDTEYLKNAIEFMERREPVVSLMKAELQKRTEVTGKYYVRVSRDTRFGGFSSYTRGVLVRNKYDFAWGGLDTKDEERTIFPNRYTAEKAFREYLACQGWDNYPRESQPRGRLVKLVPAKPKTVFQVRLVHPTRNDGNPLRDWEGTKTGTPSVIAGGTTYGAGKIRTFKTYAEADKARIAYTNFQRLSAKVVEVPA